MNTKHKIITLICLIIALVIVVGISTKIPHAPSTNTEVAPEGSPIIHDIKVSSLTDVSSIISWKTSLPTQTLLIYGIPAAEKNLEVKDPSFSTAHTIEITPLVPGANYAFKVVATTADGKTMTVEGEFTK